MQLDIEKLNSLDPKNLSPEMVDKLRQQINIVTWIENNLSNPQDPNKKISFNEPGNERPYQKDMLNFQPKYAGKDNKGKNYYVNRWKVYRMGRRLGKCLHGDTLILMKDGSYKKIKDIQINDEVVSYNKGKLDIRKVVNVIHNTDKRQLYRITFKNDQTILCTDNHDFLNTDFKWKSIDKKLSKKDTVIALDKYEYFGNINDIHEAELLPYLLCYDSLIYENVIKLLHFSHVSQVIESCDQKFNYASIVSKTSNSYYYTLTLRNKSNKLLSFAKKYNIISKRNQYKKLFERINNYDKQSIQVFLNTFYSIKGEINISNKNIINIDLLDKHLELLKFIQLLLLRLGIKSRIYNLTNNIFKLTIDNVNSLNNFFEFVGDIFLKELESKKARNILSKIKTVKFNKIDDFTDSTIINIEKYGKADTYDITVEGTHNFIANGIVTHNSVCLAAEMLYKACIKPMQKILFIGPMEYHCTNIYDMCGALLLKSGIEPKEQSKKPMHITFKNGSVIKFFTANTKTSKGSGIRGQEADHICFPAGVNVNYNSESLNTIENFKEKDEILGFDNKPYQGSVEKILVNKDKQVMKLDTPVGSVICTPEHPFTFNNQEIPAKDAEYLYFKKDHITLNFDKTCIKARLFGYILSHFTANKGRLIFRVYPYNKEQILADLRTLGDNPELLQNETLCASKLLFEEVKGYLKVGTLGIKLFNYYFDLIKSENKDIIYNLLSGFLSYNMFDLHPKGKLLSNELLVNIPTMEENKLFEICKKLFYYAKFSIRYYTKVNDLYKVAVLYNNYENFHRICNVGFCYNNQQQTIINKYKLYTYIHWNVLKTASEKRSHFITQIDKLEIFPGYWIVPVINKEYLSKKETVFNITTDKWAQHRFHANGFVVHNCIDEMDYCGDQIIEEVIMPIYDLNPTSTITAASTPTGRRGLFYKWCTQADGINRKEFHYNEEYNPRWTEEAEKRARAEYSAITYTHEYDAEFGEETTGIFAKKYLDETEIELPENDERTLIQYYNDQTYNPNNAYIMGVDWNKNWGVDIIIIERSAKDGKYKVWRHEVIEKGEETQLKAIERIITIHKTICHCAFIYIDMGFGEVQWEILKKRSEQDISLGLKDRIVGIDFGGKIEYFDSEQRTMVSKPARSFMIENAVLVVERLALSIVELEEKEKGLLDQMGKMQYIVTPSGNVLAKAENGFPDHSVMSLILALIGFRLNYEMRPMTPISPRVGNIAPKVSIPSNNEDGFETVDSNTVKKIAYSKIAHKRNILYRRKMVSSRCNF